MTSSSARPSGLSSSDALLLTVVFTGAAGIVVSWAGAAITAVLSGHPVPEINPGAAVLAISRHAGNPSAAWGQPVGPPWLYWTMTALVVAVLVAATAAGWWGVARSKDARGRDPRRIQGLATRAEVGRVAGARALIGRAGDLRPSLTRPQAGDLGHRLGRGRGVDCYASVEDCARMSNRARCEPHPPVEVCLRNPVLRHRSRPSLIRPVQSPRACHCPPTESDGRSLIGERTSCHAAMGVRSCP